MADTQTKKGEEFQADTRLEEGPIADRGCTDFLCCLLFVASWVAIWTVAGIALKNGNPMILAYPIDSSNNSCGYSSGYENYNYLFYPVPFPGYFNISVCLSQCPVGNETILLCHPNYNVTSCVVNGSSTKLEDAIEIYALGGNVQTYVAGLVFTYNTTSFVNRFCLPASSYFSELSGLSSGLESSGGDRVTQWLTDLYTCWTIILATVGIALVLGFVWMILMRHLSGVLTWLSIILFEAALAVLGYVLYQRGVDLYNTDVSNGQTPQSGTSDYDEYQGLKISGYICWGLCGIFAITVCCIFNSIRLAIGIIKAAADYVKDTPQALLLPVILMTFLGGFYAFWIIIALYLYSDGTAYSSGTSPFASIQWNTNVEKLLGFWVFELLWNNAFIIAVGQFILASSVAMWYFKQAGGHSTIFRGTYRAFRYHLGSLAFGSLVLAVVQFIKLVLAYISDQVKKGGGDKNKCIYYLLKCGECCAACFERFIKFLNKNAYIQIALTGKSFCFAAKDGFLLAMKNPVRFGLVAGLGDVFIFVGKAFITIIAVLIGYLIITKEYYYSSKIYSPIFPCIAFFIVAYCISELFMSVYGMAANSILQCFCLDEHLSSQKNSGPRSCPDSLRDFIAEHRDK